MEKSNKRGKIPQSDWPLIIARYEAGETLASIARTYDCSPPAISYVVSRGRAKQPAAAPTPAAPANPVATQLVKAAAVDASANGHGKAPIGDTNNGNGEVAPILPPHGEDTVMPAPAVGADNRREQSSARRSNGFAENGNGERPAAVAGTAPPWQRPPEPSGQPDGGDQRRTLHLSLGGSAPSNGSDTAVASGAAVAPVANGNGSVERAGGVQAGSNFVPPRPTADNDGIRHLEAAAPPRKDGGAFIDQDLRTRVDGDIAAFLAAFDAALVHDTQESRSALRDATDRLLRAGARTRIELERLEARMPLPPRGNGARPEPVWRSR